MKYKQNFDMRPFANVLILTNHEVGFLNDDSEGALRRVFIVPYEYYDPADERDFQLEDKLLNESSGILNLALEGYRNKIVNTGQKVHVKVDHGRSEIEYTKMVLDPCVEGMRTFNLNNYIDIKGDDNKSAEFINQLKDI